VRIPLLIAAALAALVPAGAAVHAQSDQQPSGAWVEWRESLPAAGELVKVRLRGDVLAQILGGAQWRLAAGESEIAAWLADSQLPGAPVLERLEILREESDADGRTTAVLDRGAPPVALDHLRLQFVAAEMLCAVSIAASADDLDYEPVSGAQVVLQRVAGGQVTRLADVACDVGEARYLKLSFAGAAGVILSKVEGWMSPTQAPEPYELSVGLGPMADAETPGEHVWPLLLADSRVPLLKLKVLAEAPGELRRMRVVRLGRDGQPETTVSEAVWVDTLTAAGIARSEKWIEVNAEGGDARPWGLVVEDGPAETLAVSGVQAYSAETWLCFAMPEDSEITLWLGEPAAVSLDPALADPQAAVYAGEVTTLSEVPVEVIESVAGGGGWGDLLTRLLDRWGRLAAFTLGGLIAIILGLVLLRRPRSAAQ